MSDQIRSDDPNALELLNARIATLKDSQAKMREANVLVRRGDKAGLSALGFSDLAIAKLLKPDYMGRTGFPAFELTNNGANIRRLEDRVKEIGGHINDISSEKAIGGVRFVDSVEENRLQIFFTGKPDENTRRELKSWGFRWTPTKNCWQAYRNANANYFANKLFNELTATQNKMYS